MHSYEHGGRMFRPFDEENIPLLVDVVLPLWGIPERGERLDRICVEYIVRKSMCGNGLNLQLSDGGEFCAAAFACRRGDSDSAGRWLSTLTPPLMEREMQGIQMSRTYIEAMDARTFSLMGRNDIKLSLFVSRRKGAGLPLLTEFAVRLAAQGYAGMYLWTDCDCTWEWYPRHGFSLVEEDIYDAFSREDEPYRTFIFKTKLPLRTGLP